jgi:hypothetical protein
MTTLLDAIRELKTPGVMIPGPASESDRKPSASEPPADAMSCALRAELLRWLGLRWNPERGWPSLPGVGLEGDSTDHERWFGDAGYPELRAALDAATASGIPEAEWVEAVRDYVTGEEHDGLD